MRLIFAVWGVAAALNAMPLGANIDGVADYSRTLPFVNIVKQSRVWGSAAAPWDGNCSVGADGWPSQASFGNVFFTSSSEPGAPSVAGTWLMAWEGAAIVTNLMRGAAVANQTYDAASDTTTAALVVASGADPFIMFGFSNASTVRGGPGIKGLQILQPGYGFAQSNDFSAPLLALLARADVLRFMDWAHTNGNLKSSWESRTTEAAVSFAPSGFEVPWEVCFRLANALGKDAWINVPAHADAGYVAGLAALAAGALAPGLNLYLEFSNEVWNWSFEQSHYALAQANASVYAGDPYHLNASGLVGDGNPGYWMARWHVAKLREAALAFGEAFGAGSVGKDRRVRPVYAWQCGDWQDVVGLPYLLQVFGEPAEVLHSIACAPYMTIGPAASSPALTVDEVLAGWRSFQQNVSVAGAGGFSRVNFVASLSAAAAYWGLRCQAYESGPDTVQGIDDGPPLWAKANASGDPRIAPIVFDYLQAWHLLGEHMGPQNYFTFGAGPLQDRYGIYSILQDMARMDTPKLAAVDRARATPVAVTPLIPAVPATLNASFFVGHPVPPQPNGFQGWCVDACDYFVRAAAPLRVTVTLTAGSDDAAAANLTIALGGPTRKIQTVACPSSGNWARYVPCAPSQPFDLPAGVSVFRVGRGRPWLGELLIAEAAA